jgi:hypothetical protein
MIISLSLVKWLIKLIKVNGYNYSPHQPNKLLTK